MRRPAPQVKFPSVVDRTLVHCIAHLIVLGTKIGSGYPEHALVHIDELCICCSEISSLGGEHHKTQLGPLAAPILQLLRADEARLERGLRSPAFCLAILDELIQEVEVHDVFHFPGHVGVHGNGQLGDLVLVRWHLRDRRPQTGASPVLEVSQIRLMHEVRLRRLVRIPGPVPHVAVPAIDLDQLRPIRRENELQVDGLEGPTLCL
mmetsp:Transcript_56220/g.101055  ORF Transcript_56220/g.101055 Transcript_56220/m.101055 type:complete len:206 (-) Transcript_56220:311-928(-)